MYTISSSDGTHLHVRVNLLLRGLCRQECSQSPSLLPAPDPHRSWEYKDNFTAWRAPRIKVIRKKLQKPRWCNKFQFLLSILHWLRKFAVSSLNQQHHKLFLQCGGYGKQYNRLFGINTSVKFLFQQANILLSTLTICRKDCHMGKKSHSKSDCTYF